jgi:hypothetical protein
MKIVGVLIASVLVLSACAMCQSSVPEARADVMYQLAPPEPGSAPPLPPNVFFRTEQLGDGKVRTGYFAMAVDTGKPVTGAPYTAAAVTETTQVLADGNRIVNKNTAFVARDSQGRTRREETMGSLGPLAVNGAKMAFINDPVAKVNYVLDLNRQSAHVMKPGNAVAGVPGMAKQGVTTNGPVVTMMAPGPDVMMAPGPDVAVQKKVIIAGASGAGPEQRVWVSNSADAADLKTESLGTQTIEGVSAEGKRVTHTIPAGQIGNERPLEITSEVWTSPDLKLVVLSKRKDPRLGETVYRLTEINRAEPDHSLFEVPANFAIKNPGD